MDYKQISFEMRLADTDADAIAQMLLDKATEAARRAYAPYSRFRVGAAALLSDGTLVTGNNQENAAYPSGLCAERVTVFYANSRYPDTAITHLLIVAETDEGLLRQPVTPCGACRQVLIETEKRQGSPIRIYLAGRDTVWCIASAAELMPLSFVPESLVNQ